MPLPEIAGRSRQAMWKIADRIVLPALIAGQLRHNLPRNTNGTPPLPGLMDPDQSATFLEKHHPDERDHLVSVADEIMEGRIEILGFGTIDCGSVPLWNHEPVADKTASKIHWSRIAYLDPGAVGDSKIVWELNRHQFLVTLGQAYRLTGDGRYADRIWQLIDAWISDNPPGYGINWTSSLEIAFRSIAWCWAWHLGEGRDRLGPAESHRFFTALEMHGRHIQKYLSHYFAPNTHLTGEALGLCYLATSWPDLKRSDPWWQIGTRILSQEAEKQVRPDGLYFERSMCYQLYTLEFLLHYILLCETRGVAPSGSVVTAAESLARTNTILRRPDGLLPNFGDDDGGRLLILGSEPTRNPAGSLTTAVSVLGAGDWGPGRFSGIEALWVVGVDRYTAALRAGGMKPGTSQEYRLSVFDSSGVVVSNGGAGDYLMVSAGAQAPLPHCLGHVHDDVMSVELWCQGHPVFLDAGTYTFTGDANLRAWYRSAAAHNTCRVDGVPGIPDGDPFRWRILGGSRLTHHAEGPTYHLVELARDLRVRSTAVCHRRRIVAFHGVGWIIWDRFYGSGAHEVALRFQLAPQTKSVDFADGFVALRSSYVAVLPATGAPPACDVIESPLSPRYGQRQPAVALALSDRADLPSDMVTVVLHRAPTGQPPRLVANPPQESPDRWHGLCRDMTIEDGVEGCHRIVLQDRPERTVAVGQVRAPFTTVWISDRSEPLMLDSDGLLTGHPPITAELPTVVVERALRSDSADTSER